VQNFFVWKKILTVQYGKKNRRCNFLKKPIMSAQLGFQKNLSGATFVE